MRVMRQTSVNKRGRVMVRGDKTSGSSASSHSLPLSQPGGKIKKEGEGMGKDGNGNLYET